MVFPRGIMILLKKTQTGLLPSHKNLPKGDSDPCVSYEGTREAIKQIGFQEIDGGGYRKLSLLLSSIWQR